MIALEKMMIKNNKVEVNKTYFVDMYTDDDALSIWGLWSFKERATNSFTELVCFTPGKRAIGKLEFLRREFMSNNERNRFPMSLTVYKDFNVEIIDSTAKGALLEKNLRVCEVLGDSQFWISDRTFQTSDYVFYFNNQVQPFEFVIYIKNHVTL